MFVVAGDAVSVHFTLKQVVATLLLALGNILPVYLSAGIVIVTLPFAASLSSTYNDTLPGLELAPTFIAGESMGLRQLATCLQANDPGAIGQCEGNPYGFTLNTELQQQLKDVKLIVLATDNQSNLMSWMEQVEAVTNLPVVAVVPQAIAPIALSYEGTGQIRGLIAGKTDLSQYGSFDTVRSTRD